MANYYGYVRSNEFKVKEGMKNYLEDIFSKVTSDGELYTEVFERDGVNYGWFGSYGTIYGIQEIGIDEDGYEVLLNEGYEYDTFIKELQKCVHENDYIQIVDVGYEKLRYVGGGCCIITSKETKCLDIIDEGKKVAEAMLKSE